MTTERAAFTPREAAAYLGVGPNLIYRLLAEGQIPHVRLGTRYVIGKTTLERMLEGGITIRS